MQKSQLSLMLNPLQSVLSLPALSSRVLPPDIGHVSRSEEKREANGSEVDSVPSSIFGGIGGEVGKCCDEGA